MRGTRLLIPFLFVAAIGCRSGKTVPEPGAVLLHVKCVAGSPTPDELRAWVYDDGGSLWDGMRIPASGPLAITSPDPKPFPFREVSTHAPAQPSITLVLRFSLFIPATLRWWPSRIP